MTLAAAWRELGITRTDDRTAIRRSYADRLRSIDVDADPAAFERLRAARDVALEASNAAKSDIASSVLPAPSAGIDTSVAPLPARPGIPVLDRSVSAPLSVHGPADAEYGRPPIGRADTGTGIDLALPTGSWWAPPLIDREVGHRIGPRESNPHARSEAAFRTFTDILLPGGEHSDWGMDDDERQAMGHAIDTLLADPRLEELGFRDQVERWIAAVLADAIPRSDELIPRFAETFGWENRVGEIGEAPAVSRVTERLAALRFVAEVGTPGHRHHRAWKELTTPANERSRLSMGVGKRRVDALLTDVRQHHPDVEAWFDGYRLGKWENKVGGPGLPWWTIAMCLFWGLSFISHLGDNTSPPSSGPDNYVAGQPIAGLSQPLSSPDVDLNSSLLALGDNLTVERLKTINPALYGLLTRRWRDQRTAGGRFNDFDRSVADYFKERRAAARSVASYDTAAALQRVVVAELQSLRDQSGAQACAGWLTGKGYGGPRPPDLLLRQGQTAANLAVVEAEPGNGKPAATTYIISGKVMEAVRTRAGWPRPRLDRALDGRGPPTDICAAQIALIETVLALPRKEGLPLLRRM